MIKLRKDIPNERRNNLAMAIFSLLFIILAAKCSGQIQRSTTENGLVYKYNERPIFYIIDKEQTRLALNINADSLGNGKFKVSLKASVPCTKNPYKIKIGFGDGTNICLNSYEHDYKFGYAGFELSNEAYNKLKTTKYDYIAFETKEALYPCVSIKNTNFFIDFLNNYYK